MRITLKLFASLAAHLPPDAADRHRVDLDVPAGATVMDVIRAQRVPEALCAIVLVDGHWVGRGDRAARELRDGEVLAIWPPVAGGSPAFERSLEMGVTREEFLRLLPAAIARFEADGHAVRWTDGERRGTIRLRALPDRILAQGRGVAAGPDTTLEPCATPATVVAAGGEGRLEPCATRATAATPGSRGAAVRIPRHRVDISLEGWSDEEGEAFMARFHRAFLRGGG